MSTESTFITALITGSEKRKVRCYNVPSGFVNTDMDKDVLMVLQGELAEMMIQIAPQVYRKYVTVDRKGTASKIMWAELMNCPLEYEDPVEMIAKTNKNQPISASKMVTWKSVVATPFKTPQVCVGHNRVSSNKLRMDRQL